MQLQTTPEVRALGLRHPRVWRLRSETPLLSAPGLTADQVSYLYDPAAPVPSGYRDLLEALGHPGVVPAGARLRELLATRGWRSHGAVIDAVTFATLRHGAGIGLHRLPDDESRDLLVARAAGTERITPAFSSKSRPVPAGDLVYGLTPQGGAPLDPFAWLGRRDCDAADHQVAESSREALLVVLGCPGEDAGHTAAIGASVVEALALTQAQVTFDEVPEREENVIMY
ncbi:hypothetical protein ACWGH5_36795 [Streptomyces sp. NPDC054864]